MDENITNLPTDKRSYTVVLNTADYDKVTSILEDQDTYEKLMQGPHSKYKKRAIDG